MSEHNLGDFLRRLARTLLDDDARTDGALLEAFAVDRDEDAFLVLVGRHAQSVWSTCRNTLADPADAEDAFQATFMALAAKAKELSGRDRLEPWLRVTAQFAARKLRRAVARRQRRLQIASEMAIGIADSSTEPPDWSAVSEEFQSLPEELRRVLSMYYLEGRTFAEVSERLGCSVATAQRRVVQAAEILRRRLRTRGITSIAGGVLAGVFMGEGSTQAMAPDLVRETVGLAKGFASGVIPPTTAGALAAELIARKSTLWVTAVAVLLLAGSVVSAVSLIPRFDRAAPTDSQPQAAVVAPVPNEPQPLAVLKGVARDENGRPVPGARITALAYFARFGQGGIRDEILGTTIADGEGRFTLPVPHFPAAVAEARRVKLLATAPDGKVVTKAVTLPVTGDVEMRVAAARTLRGVVIDSAGAPVSAAVVRLVAAGDVSLVPLAGEGEPAVSGWPAIAHTDAQGRFELTGVLSNRDVRVAVEHSELAYQEFSIADSKQTPNAPGQELRFQLGKARIVTGRVLAADTRLPVADALISAVAIGPNNAVFGRNIRVGADGTFRFAAPSGRFVSLRVHPPQGSPLLAIARNFEWPADLTTKQWDAVLPRGVAVRGRVTEAETGTPVGGALVSFNPTNQIPEKANDEAGQVMVGASALVATDKDGRFTITVPSAKGTLIVDGPSLTYLSELTNDPVTSYDGVTQTARSIHASMALDTSDRRPPAELTMTLRRGTVLTGRAVLPDGSPVKSGAVVCRHLTNPRDLISPVALSINDGLFEIPGCRVGYEYSVLLVTDNFKHGATARLKCSGNDAAPVTVTLQPSSRCSVEMRSPSNSPDVGFQVLLTVGLDPERPIGSKPKEAVTQVPYSHLFIEMRGRFSVPGPFDGVSTNQDGIAAFDGLIPGATHHVWLPGPKGEKLGVELRLPPGEEKRVSAKRTWITAEK